MNAVLTSVIDRFAGLRVLVVGETMLDTYLEGTIGRFAHEAPVPIVTLGERIDVPGGAANTAVNCRELGAAVALLSATGDDDEGARLAAALERRGVSAADLYKVAGRRTLAKQRVFAAAQMILRVDQGTTCTIDATSENVLLERLSQDYGAYDAVIVSDYGYGVITPRLLRGLERCQVRSPRVLVVDSRTPQRFRDLAVMAVKPNFTEAARLLGAVTLEGYRGRADAVIQHGERILAETGARIAAVTLDDDGAVILERGKRPYRTGARATRQGCVTGAGDTYTATLTLALAAGASTTSAAELAAAAAGVVVGKQRTATCSAHELRECFATQGKYIGDHTRLAAIVESHRAQGRRIVFTNGCFDILHPGHVGYLNRAKTLGDLLIVGVNTDRSIGRVKGSKRPINNLEDRLEVLAGLSCVDHLVAFDDDTPCNLIRIVRPDVFVKGGDYTRARLPEAPLVEELGGVVEILPYLQERSTTRIIERIQDARTAEALVAST
jgi:D-beta-D-heptose 7-phosphate kinase/D-beta-D-heptose 1-phosphate adenosyltransferase